MKIAIISDIHDNLANLQKVLDYCQKESIKTIICCGDTASEETLEFLQANFPGKILLVPGNMDAGYWDYKNLSEKFAGTNLKIFPSVGEAEFDGYKVAFVHFPEKARELAVSGKYDLVFYGHTHQPWEEKIGHCRLINPGNVANIRYPATFAVWDTNDDKLKLIRL